MVDWHTYNEALVRRDQILLDFDVIDKWDHELYRMNLGKVGEPHAMKTCDDIYGSCKLVLFSVQIRQ